ncbi:FadR/GntR family transcriptional regulator [Bacillus sp. FJAT-27445]|uniref:FadR/GntR family transcriptional regulator n=1 Tax=Bacillus sp. FJAT-27445 TaxID=1679166 RepID=UPI000AAC547B|nr:GntR family transcriptional regulator [Bacillus sp. FJAT-27445]
MKDTVKSQFQNSKVYIEIVKKLREMIAADGLKAGDKIPSERELTERLNVGRSSVREALRALELLGLIETRRGEGTFIRDFRGNQLVQILSTFILQDEKAKRDVKETKYYIEMDCLRLILKRNNHLRLDEAYRLTKSDDINDDDFFYRLILLADNHLFSRIWVILKDYYHSQGFAVEKAHPEEYHALIEAIDAGDEELVIGRYMKLRKLS